jgi:glycosyltransferase involved in cell wall biosynthesis
MIGILIPVHNEEALLAECLNAAMIAASHPGLLGEPVQILAVLDSCSDGSAAIAQAYPVQCLPVHARNVGHARGVGARHLLNQGVRWISCTDADSRVAPDWLVAQLALGTDAVCGTVTVDAWSQGFGPAAQIRYHQAYEVSVRAPMCSPVASSRWPATKMCNWCATWSGAAHPSLGATRRRSLPARAWTAVPKAVLAII